MARDLILCRHADHDPSLVCRPALGYGLCEVLADSSEEDDKERE
jgi:hypothetical protein